MALSGLRFCARAFSSCGKWGPLFIVVRGPLHYCGLSCCGAQAPDTQAQQLWLTGLVAPRYVGSSQTRARTHVPCIGRQILNHCATREALPLFSNEKKAIDKRCKDGKTQGTMGLNRYFDHPLPYLYLPLLAENFHKWYLHSLATNLVPI